jgi:hypothetical protein
MKYRTLYLFGLALLLGAAPRLTAYRQHPPPSKQPVKEKVTDSLTYLKAITTRYGK